MITKKLATFAILVCGFIASGILACCQSGCSIDSAGDVTLGNGSTSITIPAADVKAAGNVVQTGINAAITGAETQFLTTGSVKGDQLAANSLNSIATVAQGYVGQVIPPTVVSATPGVASIGNTASKALTDVVVSQQVVNALYAQAAKIAPSSP